MKKIYERLYPFLLKKVNLKDIDIVFDEIVDLKLKKKCIPNKYTIRDQKQTIEYFKSKARETDREQVWALYLDCRNRVIDICNMGIGTLTQSIMYPREIAKKGIELGALSVILIHSHPSGCPNPSESDRKITRKVLFSLKELDMNLLDHMIVGEEGYYSFYEQGFIERHNNDYRMVMENNI